VFELIVLARLIVVLVAAVSVDVKFVLKFSAGS
jgi:hypothetical protein